MLSLDRAPDGLLRVSAQGVLKAEDYAAFEQEFAEALQRRGTPTPLLLDLSRFKGWTPAGFARDLRFDLRHRHSFSRIAVLGVTPWHRWITYAAAPVFTGRLRYFTAAHEATAKAWLRQP